MSILKLLDMKKKIQIDKNYNSAKCFYKVYSECNIILYLIPIYL